MIISGNHKNGVVPFLKKAVESKVKVGFTTFDVKGDQIDIEAGRDVDILGVINTKDGFYYLIQYKGEDLGEHFFDIVYSELIE